MSILRNSAWNVAGVAIPTLIAIPAFGYYSRVLGVERLGLLTLAFAVVGYASSFDLGLSRALIREVSIERGNPRRVWSLMSTATVAVLALGVIVAAVTWLCTPELVRYLGVSLANKVDAEHGFRWLSATIPFYLLATAGASYFEGLEDFRTVNIIKTLSSALNSIGGVLALIFFPTLEAVLVALFAARFITCLITYWLYWITAARQVVATLPKLKLFERRSFERLLRYGSWLTVSNIVGPVMIYFDRFILAHFAGAHQVAFYTVPSEMVSRLSLFPAAIAKALFPRLSQRGSTAAADRRLGVKMTLVSCALTIGPVFVFGEQILTLWVGPAYTGTPVTVLRILLVGLFFNSMAFGPFTDLQARGHSKVTAITHLGELLPYLAIVVYLTIQFGIVGTAISWSLRTLVDFLLLRRLALKYAH